MRTITTIGLTICLLGFSSAAHAARLSSPAVFGGHTQTVASCLVFNGGTDTQELTIKILTESGTVESATQSPLPPGQSIQFRAPNIGFGVAYACTVDARRVANLRAVFVLHETHFVNNADIERPIRSVPLR
jgi:hypothetical protein